MFINDKRMCRSTLFTMNMQDKLQELRNFE